MSFSKSNNFPDYGATDSRYGVSRNVRPQPKSNFGIFLAVNNYQNS